MTSTFTPPARFNGSSTADEVASALAEQIRGKHVLITGVSPGGLGAEAARAIARQGPALLILAGRTQSKINETASAIRAESPSANLRTLLLDLSSLDAVRKSALEVNRWTEPIDVLINNAGTMFTGPQRRVTVDGFESTFATNYLGPFLLTNLIKPRLLASPSPRVINLSSAGHAISDVRLGDLNLGEEGVYQPFLAYGHSKTANLLFNVALAEKWKEEGVKTFALHPGVIWTNGVPNAEAEFKAAGYVTEDGKPSPNVDWKTMAQGAATHLVAAFDPDLGDHSGAYLVDGQVANDQAQPYALDQENALKLWAATEVLLKQVFV
ncbi:hypothetical protein BCR35DRAFT_342622 [Leucosporidium creatinivorum]|uniref:Short-chain dehydrogenase n=1 Tax=Leucosporidium creatinivorum TaxID=106004 RepID=A0A1Y2EZZ5_9BASI|nr:hypothetical protein BCR35DRAFT_342622 [Leucosporidium creatinivorum]